ncbi:hypothetical protein A2U01_0005269 [Trifolium medium]|uniref:Uncharacterized protein n=1 Tax=Trifolium medium TaxID=97028 RepID=A0A392MAB0_9FABA|nr:hypothetical protein [Trifolium medium]
MSPNSKTCSRRHSAGKQATPMRTAAPFENYFNSAGVVEIDGGEERSIATLTG